MRITIDIEDKKLNQILKATRLKKMSPAIARALDEFLENRRRQAFLAKILAGKTDYASTNAEVEALSQLER